MRLRPRRHTDQAAVQVGSGTRPRHRAGGRPGLTVRSARPGADGGGDGMGGGGRDGLDWHWAAAVIRCWHRVCSRRRPGAALILRPAAHVRVELEANHAANRTFAWKRIHAGLLRRVFICKRTKLERLITTYKWFIVNLSHPTSIHEMKILWY